MIRRTSDLLVVVALAIVVPVAILTLDVPWAIRWALGIPYLLVMPGYALIAAAFPEAPRDRTARGPATQTPGWAARFGLSLVGSALLVATVAVGLSWTYGIYLVTVLPAISAVTIGASLLAMARRLLLPEARRADPLGEGIFAAGLGGLSHTRFQTVLMVVAVVGLAGAVGYAIAVPPQGDGYSEVYLLEQGSDAQFAGGGEPPTIIAGTEYPLSIAIENHEHESVTYDVLIRAQRFAPDGTVRSQRTLDTADVELAPDTRHVLDRSVSLQATSDARTRLQVLVFTDGLPENPDAANTTLAVHRWIEVVEGTNS